MAGRMHSDKFIFWVKAALALQITKEGLCSIIEKKMTEFVRILSKDQENHLRTSFLPKLLTGDRVQHRYASKRGSEKIWKFKSDCATCLSMFERILEIHARKQHPSINWECHSTSEQVSSTILWWIIAKIFMPGDNRSSKGPIEVDPLALFSLIMNCKLFSILWFDTQEVIDVRNKLMHHPSNSMSELEMKDVMGKMKKLLSQEFVKETSNVALNDIEKLEQERIVLTKLSKRNKKMVSQALYLKRESLEFDKQEHLRTGMSIEKLDLELQKTKEEIVKENYCNIDDVERLSNINLTLQEKCIRLQKNYDCEHQIRTQLEEIRHRQRRRAYWMLTKSIAQKKKVNKIKVENIRLRKRLSESEKDCRNLRKSIAHRKKVNKIKKENIRLRKRLSESEKDCKNWRKVSIDLYINERAKRKQFEKENILLLMKVSKTDEKVLRTADEVENLNVEIEQMKIQKDLPKKLF